MDGAQQPTLAGYYENNPRSEQPAVSLRPDSLGCRDQVISLREAAAR